MNTLNITIAAKIAMIQSVIAAAKDTNQIVGISFIKKDGKTRNMAFRTGIAKGLTGGRPEAVGRLPD